MASATDILAALQNAVVAINALSSAIRVAFPSAGQTSSAAPSVGTLVFNSSQASVMLAVTIGSSGNYRIPLYPP